MRTRLTSAEVAASLGYTPTWVARLAARYEVGKKIGKNWTFTATDLKCLERHKRTVKMGAPPGPRRKNTGAEV